MKKNLIRIDPIFVRDKKDVVEAFEILEKIGMAASLSTEEKRNAYLADNTRTVENNFIMQEDGDEGYRIQSHYLGDGMTIESLKKQVDKILLKHPNIKEQIEAIRKEKTRIKDLELELKENLEKEIKKLNVELKENTNGIQNIQITEEK